MKPQELENENGAFIYYKEDDDLISDDIAIEAYLENTNSESNGVLEWFHILNDSDRLMEGVDDLSKFRCGDVIIGNIVFQQDYTQHKARPCIFLCANGEKALVFQVTSQCSEPRKSYRYPIKDWQQLGLTKPSYVNFECYIVVNKKYIADIKLGKLSDKDKQGLIEQMRSTYDGATDPKYNYDRFIRYLSR